MEDYISYGHQHVDEEDIRAVVDVLRSPLITQGPKIKEFESILASYCGAKYCAAFSSGTAALHASFFAAGIGQEDEIITSPITFAATANAALYLGARPVFTDIEETTGNLDVDLLEESITNKTKAIVPVHFAGQPVDLDAIHAIAKKYDLTVIEDACHALGAEYKGKKIGALSDMTVFSFHPLKTITAGEGGAVVTDEKELFQKMMMFRNHGLTKDKEMMSEYPGDWFYEMHYLGYNYRITDFQCALAISQMKKLDGFVSKRASIAAIYNEAFESIEELEPLTQEKGRTSAWHIYVIRLDPARSEKTRKYVFDRLRSDGIGVQVHYIPVYWQPYYLRKGYHKGLCPVAEDYYERAITLPLYPAMEKEDAYRVIKAVRKALVQ
jgi:perosamine synthetase